MKFIHVADVHLDSPFLGLSFLPSQVFNEIALASDHSLAQIVDLALAEKVDLVLLAGDTFDSPQPSPRSQLLLAKQIERLTQQHIQVVMIFGNHDHMRLAELLVTPSPYFKLLGANEQIERVSCTTKTGFQYDVTGFSYLHNHILTDQVAKFPDRSEQFNFGLAHMQLATSEASQNVYAPFTLAALKALQYDYFALGHIHLRQTLSEDPLIVYPGNVQGRHIKETGPKGCYLGEIDEQTRQVSLTFHSTAAIQWESVQLELREAINKADLMAKLLTILPAAGPQPIFYSVTVLGAQFLTAAEQELLLDSDFWEQLSHQLAFKSRLVDVRFKVSHLLTINPTDQPFFDSARAEVLGDTGIMNAAQDWAKKDSLAAALLTDPTFIAEVKAATEVTLAAQLKGIDYETETN
ncbi:MAG: DNA repair exonuclease [Lactobacillus sp.]|nr:DNA repair exonuclease [Lactobacillus sp.]MDN6042901.1 DNA repair exonuclease [Lactobacillus sp.]MDN6051955.1 DNA repair exonuclease [Lactobacillus sp.]